MADHVASILEPYYSARNEHEKLISIYIQRLELLDDSREIYDVWMLIAHIFLNELEDQQSAIGAYGKALEQQPDEQHIVDELMRLAGATGAWGEAAELIADALESENATDEARVRLFFALATIFDEHLGLYEEAEESYLSVLQYDPGEPRALEALDRIYEGQGRWDDLARILARRIEGIYDEELIVSLQFRRAQLFQGQLAELDRAVQTYHEVLNVQPVHAPSLKMLAQIHYQRQEWQPLYDVLSQQADIQNDPDERANTFAQMAQIAEEALEHKDDAVDLWNRVLQMQPDNLSALRELRRLYLQDERWSDLVSVLEIEVDDPRPDELRVKKQGGIVWLALAMMVRTRLWLAGEVSEHRDMAAAKAFFRSGSDALEGSGYPQCTFTGLPNGRPPNSFACVSNAIAATSAWMLRLPPASSCSSSAAPRTRPTRCCGPTRAARWWPSVRPRTSPGPSGSTSPSASSSPSRRRPASRGWQVASSPP